MRGSRSFALPEFDPVWARLQEAEVPVCLHASFPPLTSYYEMAFTSREEAIWTKEQLLEPPPPLGTDPVTREGR